MIVLSRFLKDHSGTAVAETAIMFLLYFYFIFMGIIFSMAIWSKIIVYDAAREGARYQALGQGPAAIKVSEVLTDGLLKVANLENVSVSEGSEYVTVSVHYKQPSFLPFIPILLGGDPLDQHFPIKGAALFKIEH